MPETTEKVRRNLTGGQSHTATSVSRKTKRKSRKRAPYANYACVACRSSKKACDDDRPCARCVARGLECESTSEQLKSPMLPIAEEKSALQAPSLTANNPKVVEARSASGSTQRGVGSQSGMGQRQRRVSKRKRVAAPQPSISQAEDSSFESSQANTKSKTRRTVRKRASASHLPQFDSVSQFTHVNTRQAIPVSSGSHLHASNINPWADMMQIQGLAVDSTMSASQAGFLPQVSCPWPSAAEIARQLSMETGVQPCSTQVQPTCDTAPIRLSEVTTSFDTQQPSGSRGGVAEWLDSLMKDDDGNDHASTDDRGYFTDDYTADACAAFLHVLQMVQVPPERDRHVWGTEASRAWVRSNLMSQFGEILSAIGMPLDLKNMSAQIQISPEDSDIHRQGPQQVLASDTPTGRPQSTSSASDAIMTHGQCLSPPPTLSSVGLTPIRGISLSLAEETLLVQKYGAVFLAQQAIFERMPHPVVVSALYPRPFMFSNWCNSAFCKLIGRSREQIQQLGSKVGGLIGFYSTASALSLGFKSALAVLKGRNSIRQRVTVIHQDTGARHELVSNSFFYYEDDEPIYCVNHLLSDDHHLGTSAPVTEPNALTGHVHSSQSVMQL